MLGIHRIQLRGLNAIIDFVLFIGHWDFGRYIKVYRYLLCGRNTRNILNIRMKTASIIMVSIELHCIMSCYHGVTEYCIVSSCFLFFFCKTSPYFWLYKRYNEHRIWLESDNLPKNLRNNTKWNLLKIIAVSFLHISAIILARLV